jgi:hypothetical protein
MAKKGKVRGVSPTKNNKENIWRTGEELNLPRPKTFFKKMDAEGREAGTWGGGYSKP